MAKQAVKEDDQRVVVIVKNFACPRYCCCMASFEQRAPSY